MGRCCACCLWSIRTVSCHLAWAAKARFGVKGLALGARISQGQLKAWLPEATHPPGRQDLNPLIHRRGVGGGARQAHWPQWPVPCQGFPRSPSSPSQHHAFCASPAWLALACSLLGAGGPCQAPRACLAAREGDVLQGCRPALGGCKGRCRLLLLLLLLLVDILLQRCRSLALQACRRMHTLQGAHSI